MKPVSKTLREKLGAAQPVVGSPKHYPMDVIRPGLMIVDPRRTLHGLDLEDPRIVALVQEMIRVGKAQAMSERDSYRELLEARVAGLEALLTAIVQQIPRGHGDTHLTDNINKALAYLAGSGRL